MLRHFSIPVVFLALASSGCGTDPVPCDNTCPDISGVYSIENAAPVGQCSFSPYLLAPTVEILQTDNGRRVMLEVIDPSTQLEVPLVGDVFAPAPGDDLELLGSFRVDARTVRAAGPSDERTLTLDVSASGSVSVREGRRVLSATLMTMDAVSGKGCTHTLSITGLGD
ncbi:hypothetical protein JQX13_14040 [Archangium violaceum]|uniref:hypothetical protein n=1 Tax=Archangium violaceum TaxID=83451 RepID=UPI00193C2C7E|nr:hypothetical protein [Archangium violaceum]QRK11087.1 hypothetical protein JQX13_14040 [Archangium violaceum]